MNDSLNRWLTNRGFTGSLNDKTKQYLLTIVVGSADTDSLNDLWIRYGAQQGYTNTTLEGVQLQWAIVQGASSTQTWNDAMGTLPP